MERIASVPGLPPILACAALVAIWEIAARLLAIDGLPPASAALAQVPAILGDPEALLNIAASLRRMADRLCAGLAVAVPVGLMMGRSRLRRRASSIRC